MAGAAELFDLSGAVAVVTGASGGLGRRFARTLADAGAAVALAARRVDEIAAAAAEIEAGGGRALAVRLDVTDAGGIARMVRAVADGLGPIAVLVNNAGIAVTRPALEQTEADWDRVLDVDLKGCWLTARAVAEHMVGHGRGGSIVNVASIAGLRPIAHVPGYVAAKAGLIRLSEALALEWARHGIRVNTLAPGYIRTPLNAAFLDGPAGGAMVRRIPTRRFGEPADLDGALLLLASNAGRHITGATLVVDGGHSVSSL
ncbi:MAG TPA: glucose 1-dehydrogenase [Geminicoccaceae bacterium]|nr:glucose 1-dehydrogenase [Geminicoccaceae bacterium]